MSPAPKRRAADACENGRRLAEARTVELKRRVDECLEGDLACPASR